MIIYVHSPFWQFPEDFFAHFSRPAQWARGGRAAT